MEALDIIFYRLYLSYKRVNEPEIFSSLCFLTFIFYWLFDPIVTIFGELFREDSGRAITYVHVIYGISIFTFLALRYKRSRVNYLLRKYRHSKYRRFRNRELFCVLVASFVFGLTQHILICKYVIDPFHLEVRTLSADI